MGDTAHQSIRVECIELPPASAFSLPFSPFDFRHTIIAVTSGTMKIIDGGHTVAAAHSQIYILPQHCIIKATGEERAKFRLLLFTDAFLRKAAYLANTGAFTMLKGEFTHMATDDATFKVVKKLLLLLDKHQNSAHPSNSPVIFALTFNLLLSCLAELHAYTPRVIKKGLSRKEHVSYRFLRLASEHAQHHHDVRYYADKLCMTQGNLTKILKITLGRAPKAILEELLVKHAKAYLDREPDSIYAIADALCFKSSPAFINFFRFHTGLTPNEYRNRKTLK